MGILFKTYNGKHQLHLYKEEWIFPTKENLDDFLKMIPKKSVANLVISQEEKGINVKMNGVIVDCRDLNDLKDKFGKLTDLKEEYQKVFASAPEKKPGRKPKAEKPAEE